MFEQDVVVFEMPGYFLITLFLAVYVGGVFDIPGKFFFRLISHQPHEGWVGHQYFSFAISGIDSFDTVFKNRSKVGLGFFKLLGYGY